MEGIGVLIALVLVAAFVCVLILPIVALVRARGVSENAALLRSEIEILRERTRNLTQRIADLEKGAAVAKAAVAEPASSPAERPTPCSAPEAHVEPPHLEVAPTAKPARPIEPPILETTPRPPVVQPAEHPRVTPPRVETAREHATAPAAPSFSIKAAPSPRPAPPRNLADLEEVLGANWLNKIGITALVIGMALLLNYTMRYLGPGGKILLGYVCSALLIGIGVFGERRERYRMPARAVLGGGWALAYFTTYAMHNVAAVKLIDSAELGFALLFAVAVAMVAHSLKYNSELATGFAYLLAFTTVAVSEIPLGALVASAILAVSLAYVLKVRRWFIVEPLAIVATYFVHWLWLNQVFDRLGGPRPFPEFPLSLVLVTAYWLIYIVSYFLRKPENRPQTQLLTISFLLNAAGYLTLLQAQSFHPEWRFWFLLFNGAAYFAVAGWARVIDRRAGFLVASTLGAILMIGAIPYRYSGGRLEIIWLIETESLLLVGWKIPDRYLRALAAAAGALLAGYVGVTQIVPRFVEIGIQPDLPLAWVLVAIAGAFFLNGLLKSRLEDGPSQTDEVALTAAPILATVFLLAAAWVALQSMWIGFVWLVAGVALAELGLDVEDLLLRYCGYGAVAMAVGRLALWNLGSNERWEYGSLRLFTVGLSCAILYIASRRHFTPAVVAPKAGAVPATSKAGLASYGGFAAFYTGAATILAVPLILQELTSAAVALAFGLVGLVLFEAGDWLADNALSLEGAAVLCLSFGRIFVADLNATEFFSHRSDAVLTVPILAAIYYFIAYTMKKVPAFRVAALCFGTASLAALIRFETVSPWVAVWWAAFAVVLYTLGRSVSDAFRFQAYAITLLVALRCMVANFDLSHPWPGTTELRVATVVAASGLLYVLFVWSKLMGGAASPVSKRSGPWESIVEREFHLFFFVPTLLITALIGLEVRRGYLTAAWGVEAVVIFLAVLKLDERAYRWFSLGLLSVCVLRILLIDVWTLDALGRIISFIGLGAALLVISFLYARHRELLRRVL
ncbi:MAG: DUF2339 domain-containing protein [Candidatus Acidiferrales bacterium]